MEQIFHGKVALVTGGASGIGKVAAQIFAAKGAKVAVATDSNIQGGEETVAEIKSAGGEAIFIKCDVTSESDVEAMVKQIVEKYGSLDCAFNNAGVGPDGKRLPVIEIAECPSGFAECSAPAHVTYTDSLGHFGYTCPSCASGESCAFITISKEGYDTLQIIDCDDYDYWTGEECHLYWMVPRSTNN